MPFDGQRGGRAHVSMLAIRVSVGGKGLSCCLFSAADHRIPVQGKLKSGWNDRLAGMEIQVEFDNSDGHITTQTGELRDQAELSGVLESLYSLHLPIIRVERIHDL
jgi:hypothetical protein